MNRIDDLNAWRIFCEVVRAEGLNAACERLDCEPSTASRSLRALEAELGGALFTRATRPVSLTELGRQAYPKAVALLAQHEEMLADLRGDKDKLEGVIRVSSNAAIGPTELTPALLAFQQIYPDIQFELHEITAPLPEGFLCADGIFTDVAIGYGDGKPLPGVVKRYSGEMPFVPCASPAYIKRYGMPRVPEDCLRHTGLLISGPTRSAAQALTMGDRTENLRWKKANIMHSINSLKSALMLGAGVVPDLPLFHCAEELENQQLVQVLPGWHRSTLSCYVSAREEAYEKRRVQIFTEWIAERERGKMASLRERFPQFYMS